MKSIKLNGFKVDSLLKVAAPCTLAMFLLNGCGDSGGNEEAAAKANEQSAEVVVEKPELIDTNGPSPTSRPGETVSVATTTAAKLSQADRRDLPKAPSGLTKAPSKDALEVGRNKLINEDIEPLEVIFEPESLQLGIMQPGVPKTGTITLVNNGDKPVQIRKAVASCGCTTPNWPRDPIAPGETADIEITLKPGIKQGQKLSKRVTLQMVDGPPQILKVEGEVGMFVRISPSSLDSNKQEDGPTTITLDSADEVPFAVISVDPAVTVEAASEKGLHHELVIDWEKWEQLNRRPQIKIRTDHPNAPEMSVIVRRSIKKGDRPTPPPVTRTSSLINAARSNNLEALAGALAAGDDVNDNTGLGGMTALHWTAKNGNPDLTRALIAVKGDPNSPNKVGKTPVTLAAEEGHLEVLQMLLDNGGNMEAIDQIGGTPLLWASGLCQTPETVEFLIGKGANVNIVDINGMTPLIWAAGIGQPAVVRMLLDNGADLDVAEIHQKETALMRAARIGKPESLEMILKAGADVNAANALGHTATMIAAETAPLAKVRMIVEAGPDLTAKDIRGWTVLDYAKTRTDPNRAQVIEYIESVMPAAEPEPASGG